VAYFTIQIYLEYLQESGAWGQTASSA